MAKVRQGDNVSAPASEELEAGPGAGEDEETAGAYKLNPRLATHSATEIGGITFTHDEPVELTQEQVDEVKGFKVPYYGEMVRAIVKA